MVVEGEMSQGNDRTESMRVNARAPIYWRSETREYKEWVCRTAKPRGR
jgi:hypothetical protein